MHILLFGAAGQVGCDCREALLAKGYELSALTRQDADFSKPEEVVDAIQQRAPELVINATAYTAVDKAESEPELADWVNNQSVAAMAAVCAELNAPLIHLSTDYVFDGSGQRPYLETDAVSPLGVYGRTKLDGELAIQKVSEGFIILRTSWVFGCHGNNFVKTMLRLGAQREELNIVNDQHGCPSFVGDIVTSILAFVAKYQAHGALPWGVYHCSSQGQTTWYDFARAIFSTAAELEILKRAPRVLPIPSIEYPTPAPRPAYSVLSTAKLRQFMGEPLPHWQSGLQTVLQSHSNLQSHTK